MTKYEIHTHRQIITEGKKVHVLFVCQTVEVSCCWSCCSPVTGFVPRDVELMDEENEGPVETVRVDSDRYLLHAALLWLIFVMLVCMLRSRLLASCLEHFGSRIGRRPFLQHNLQ